MNQNDPMKDVLCSYGIDTIEADEAGRAEAVGGYGGRVAMRSAIQRTDGDAPPRLETGGAEPALPAWIKAQARLVEMRRKERLGRMTGSHDGSGGEF